MSKAFTKTSRDYVRKNNDEDTLKKIDELLNVVRDLGFLVEFGNIGKKTTYCLMYREDSDEEVVGYTFIKNSKYTNANVGKLKALQQAIARKELLDDKAREESME